MSDMMKEPEKRSSSPLPETTEEREPLVNTSIVTRTVVRLFIACCQLAVYITSSRGGLLF